MRKKHPLHKKYFILSFLKNKIRDEDIYKVGPMLKVIFIPRKSKSCKKGNGNSSTGLDDRQVDDGIE